MMSKKLKDVFEKDKTRFSNEELEWQQKFEYTTIRWLFIIFLISAAIVIFTSCFVPRNRNQEFIILVIWLIIFLVIGTVFMFLSNGGAEAKKQLEENIKKQKREKILFCIEQKDFSRLKLKNDEIAQVLFQLAVKENLINIYKEVGMVFLEVKKEGNVWIANSYDKDLLEIFDIKGK